MSSKKFSDFWLNVLLRGQLDVSREFLPLLKGRRKWNIPQFMKQKTSSNGGRIVNISSAAA